MAEILQVNQALAHATRYRCPEDACKVLRDKNLIENFVKDPFSKANRNSRSNVYMVAKECLEKCPNKPENLKQFYGAENNLIGSVAEEVKAAFMDGNQEAAHRLGKNCNGPHGVEIRRALWGLPDNVYNNPNMEDPQKTVLEKFCSWSYEQENQHRQTEHLGSNDLPTDKQEL